MFKMYMHSMVKILETETRVSKLNKSGVIKIQDKRLKKFVGDKLKVNVSK